MRLVIAVDELNEPLRATVTFLNSHSEFDFLLLQLSSFEESKSRKVLIPLVFGYTPKTGTGGRTRPPWDIERFLADATNRCEPKIVDTIKRLYEFSREKASNVSWGRGVSVGSFTFQKSRYETLVSIFTVWSNGLIQLNFGKMKDYEVKDETLESFRTRLNEIPSVRLDTEVVSVRGKYPSVKISLIMDAANLKHFQDAVLHRV